MRSTVTIREAGPREGLQADPQIVPTDVKVRLIRILLEAGLKSINAVSLVHPKAMPQMADAEAVLEQLGPQDATISALAPNRKAVERAVALGKAGLLHEALLVHATTGAVLEANGIKLTLKENLAELKELAELAKEADLRVAAFVSAAFGCSVEGRVDPHIVHDAVGELVAIENVDEVVISDSTGQADPVQVEALLGLVAPVIGSFPAALHFHDSRGAGLANVVAALSSAIPNLTFDTSFGGLGGDVPFLPEAAGNVATEDLCEMLHGMGISTGVAVPKVVEASRLLNEATGRLIQSRVYTVGPVSWKTAPARD